MNLTPKEISALISQYGPPGYENAKGLLTKLNENFWAACYAKEKEKIIFEPNEREFYDYHGLTGIFDPKSADVIRTELSAQIMDAANNWNGFKALESFRTTSVLSGVVGALRGQVEERDFFNQDHYYVHLGNCVLRFAADGSKITKEKFSPDHRSRNRSPINYEPKATCALFTEKLLGHLPDDDKILLQKYSGQCLLGRNLTQRLVILDGVGGASKGAFVLTLGGIVGGKNIYELWTSLLGERFEIGRMTGRTLLVGSDVKGNFLSDKGASRIKSLVGGDPLEAELKGSNHRFTIFGVFNLLITSNSRLRIYLEGDQTAWERRIIIVRYERPFSGQRIFEIEKYLPQREAPGILNWCIDGLKMLIADYYATGDIILSPAQQKRVSDLLTESDSLRLFITNEIVRDNTVTAGGGKYSLTVEKIIKEYSQDCTSKDWSPLAPTTIEKTLPGLMMRIHQVAKSNDIPRGNKQRRGFWGVRF
jgi:phage/plasmid-associated DNA primase